MEEPETIPRGRIRTIDDTDVLIHNRMTLDEWQREKERIPRLLEELSEHVSTWAIEIVAAYASQRRVGVRFTKTHDPLGNGVLVGNIQGWTVEAVNPCGIDEVYIRFQEAETDA